MKIVLTADIHLKIWKDTETVDNVPKRLCEIVDAIETMCEYAVSNDIDSVGILGDINDLKDIIHTRAYVYFIDRIIMPYSGLHFYMLHGNHDASSNATNRSSVDIFRGYHNVTSITRPTIVDNMLFVPHSNSILEEIEKNYEQHTKYLMSHFGLNEASLSSGISLRTNIGVKHLSKFARVFLGHYHKPQEVGNVIYIGSPIQLRRDEFSEEKRFIAFDSDSNTFESIPLKGAREYHNFTASTKEELNQFVSSAKELVSDGHYVTIRSNFKTDDEIPYTDEDIHIIDDYVDDTNRRGINTSMTLLDQMKKYMEINNIPAEQLDEYLKIGLGVINSD